MAKIDDSVKKKVPELRFPGFTDDWEERKLNENVENIGTGRSSFKAGLDYSEQTPYEVLGSTSVISYSDSFDHSGNFVLTARVGANAGNLYKHSGNVKISDNTVYIQSKNLEFIFYLLTKYDLKKLAFGTGQPLIKASELKNLKLFFPKKFGEQQKIGSFFKQLDETIALHQRKLDLLKEQKKGYLQKMFPKNGAKVPELRFAGFADDWEERKLGELVEQIIREVPKPNKPYYRMSVRSHAKGTFKQFVDNPENVAMDKLFVVKKDDLVVNITFAWEHAIAVVNEENDGLLVSHRFPTYRADGKSDIEFLHHVVSKENFRRKLEFISPGGAGRNRVLNKKDFLKLKIFVPKIEEQQKIGSFFKQLDNTIALHQRKLDLLKEQKKGFLQKMFV
ncbi:restriction endonuclease subunit S (plasmid) [Lactococcus lactis subsp. lactis]